MYGAKFIEFFKETCDYVSVNAVSVCLPFFLLFLCSSQMNIIAQIKLEYVNLTNS